MHNASQTNAKTHRNTYIYAEPLRSVLQTGWAAEFVLMLNQVATGPKCCIDRARH